MKVLNLFALSTLLVSVVFTGCKKESLEIHSEAVSQSGKNEKVKICHYSDECECYITIEVSEKALATHMNHGDLEHVEGVECGVQEEPFIGDIPTVFSPNGDGIDDVFYIESTGLTSYELIIKDRRGNHIRIITDPDTGWDGDDLNGIPMPTGTYLFELRSDQFSTVFGAVNLN